jgi:hypothetical protein
MMAMAIGMTRSVEQKRPQTCSLNQSPMTTVQSLDWRKPRAVASFETREKLMSMVSAMASALGS